VGGGGGGGVGVWWKAKKGAPDCSGGGGGALQTIKFKDPKDLRRVVIHGVLSGGGVRGSGKSRIKNMRERWGHLGTLTSAGGQAQFQSTQGPVKRPN